MVSTSKIAISVLVGLSFVWLWLLSWWLGVPTSRVTKSWQSELSSKVTSTGQKVILVRPMSKYIPLKTALWPCRHKCRATANERELPSLTDFDAIVINIPLMLVREDNLTDLMYMPRSPHQRYVMFSGEAPLQPRGYVYAKFKQPRDFPYDMFKDFFNWTMTYRHDSDIFIPHGTIRPHKGPKTEEWLQYDRDLFMRSLSRRSIFFKNKAKKPGKVAWVSSHCYTRSRRQLYVKELQKYINVSSFGACGQRMFGTVDQGVDSFKFYLAFENALCKDYVTEKFFARIGRILPVVMGSGQWSKIAPPHSYIDATKFTGPKGLAEYLNFLDRNPEEYLSYFWWMEHYKSHFDRVEKLKTAFCQLCHKLHNSMEPTKIVDLQKWWYEESECVDVDYWFLNATSSYKFFETLNSSFLEPTQVKFNEFLLAFLCLSVGMLVSICFINRSWK